MKLASKKLVYRVGGVNRSGCMGMAVGNEANSCRRFFWCNVGMAGPDTDVDKGKYWDLRFHGGNQSFPGEIVLVCLK